MHAHAYTTQQATTLFTPHTHYPTLFTHILYILYTCYIIHYFVLNCMILFTMLTVQSPIKFSLIYLLALRLKERQVNHRFVHVHACVYTKCMYIQYLNMYISIHINGSGCVHAGLCLFENIHLCVCICICMYIYNSCWKYNLKNKEGDCTLTIIRLNWRKLQQNMS